MKCIRCGRDSKLSERPHRTCPGCHQLFAFEPREGDKITDAAFASAIDRVSSGGEVWWGVEHLYYEVARRMHKRRAKSVVPGIIVAGVFATILSFALHPVVGALIVTIAVVWWVAVASTKALALERAAFEALWTRWKTTHGAPRRLITRKPPAALPPARPLDPDIPSYSFDRAVVCDRARTVDLLLANNFHFENNCAVLSIDGYPQHAFETVRAMLKNNPRLRVYTLHDATTAGCELAHAVAHDPAWFGGKVQVIDVGLRPSHARAYRGLWLKRSNVTVRPSALGQLTAQERAWLAAGWTLELAAIAPEQVIKRLYRALASDRAAEAHPVTRADGGGGSSDGGVVLYSGGPGMDADASASDGGGDSFG